MKKLAALILVCMFLATPLLPAMAQELSQPQEVTTASESDWRFSVGVEAYNFDFDGDIKIGKSGIPDSATEIDLKDDVALEDDFTFKPYAELAFGKNETHTLRASYTSLELEGDTTLDETEIFRNVIFAKDIRVTTKIDIDIFDLKYSYRLIRNEQFKWGLNLQGHYYSLDASMKGTFKDTASVSAKRDLSSFVPTVGTDVTICITPRLRIDLGINGMKWSTAYIDSYLEAHTEIEFDITDCFTLEAGYRLKDLEISKDENEGQLRSSEPYVGGRFNF